MRLTKPALTALLLILTTLGAPHLASEMWAFAQSPQSTPAPTLSDPNRPGGPSAKHSPAGLGTQARNIPERRRRGTVIFIAVPWVRRAQNLTGTI
jgi:hypothetical protein